MSNASPPNDRGWISGSSPVGWNGDGRWEKNNWLEELGSFGLSHIRPEVRSSGIVCF